MARIIFQQIADNRFSQNIVKEIERLKNETDTALEKIGTKNTGSGICRFVDFQDGTKQYRVDYIIEKEKHFTYNDLYKAVNSVKAVPYTIKR
jgi:hypothetical protein